MSTPSSLIDPERDAPGTNSCRRVKIRRNVDLPQPEGPIRAVTMPGSIVRETRSRTLWEPNHALTFVDSNLDGDDARVGSGCTCAVTGPTYSSSVVVMA